MTRRFWAWLITVGALIAAGVHLLWPWIAVDAVTLTLLLVAVLPWLTPLFKTVELPGGVKLEFAELERVQREAESAGILASPKDSREKSPFPSLIQTEDPNLALAGLRIELERRLRKIATRHGILTERRSVGHLMRDLQARDLLSREQSSILADLLPSLNAAVHGTQVDPRASAWAADIGPQLLAGLESQATVDMDSLLASWRSADGAGVAEVGEELSKAAAQSPREFLRVMSSAPEAFERWLKELQFHTFTVYQSRNDLEDELYEAFYERLRQKLLETMKAFSQDPVYGNLAQLTAEALESIRVRFVQ